MKSQFEEKPGTTICFSVCVARRRGMRCTVVSDSCTTVTSTVAYNCNGTRRKLAETRKNSPQKKRHTAKLMSSLQKENICSNKKKLTIKTKYFTARRYENKDRIQSESLETCIVYFRTYSSQTVILRYTC